MLTPDQVMGLVGEVPNDAFEWGRFVSEERVLLTVAIPHIGPPLLVLKFDVERPLEIDHDTPIEVLLADERCRGVCHIQTAVLVAISEKFEIDDLISTLAESGAIIIAVGGATSKMKGEQYRRRHTDD